jgi:hypothetical protein
MSRRTRQAQAANEDAAKKASLHKEDSAAETADAVPPNPPRTTSFGFELEPGPERD